MKPERESPDDRVAALWKTLDSQNEGSIDLAGLKRGLRSLDHPLRNADDLIKEVMTLVDTNQDGRIQYSEFRVFVQTTEKKLRALFGSIDKDQNGLIDKTELQSAFTRAGLSVSSAKLDRFFAEVDKNNDGAICFEEWRDFLLFLPAPVPNLASVITYFSSTFKMTADGDINVSQDGIKDTGYFIAGGVAGAVSRTATAPLDRLKVYLISQTDVVLDKANPAKRGSVLEAMKRSSRIFSDALKELWHAGGVRSLFAGNGLNIVKIMPETAIKFGSYEGTKKLFARLEGQSDVNKLNPKLQFLAGGLSGMLSQAASYPIDTLKFQMQCETVKGGLQGSQLIKATAAKVWKTEGPRAFYRGLTMGLVGMFPYAAIDLGTFEYLKRNLTRRNALRRGCAEADAVPGGLATAAMGGLSGALAASLVYPLNVLRTRLQSQGTVLHPRRYTGMVDVTRQTLKGEGFRGFYKGLTPNLLKVVPAVSIVSEGAEARLES